MVWEMRRKVRKERTCDSRSRATRGYSVLKVNAGTTLSTFAVVYFFVGVEVREENNALLSAGFGFSVEG